jgi:hypothetical protein
MTPEGEPTAMTTAADQEYLSLGQAAELLGVRDWQLDRVFRRGLAEEPPRSGRQRLIDRRSLPRLRQALTEAGYLLRGGLSR